MGYGSRLSADWIPVTECGADPAYSAAVNTRAFSAAIARLGNQPGAVYVPAGTYSLTAGQLELRQGQSLIGAGPSASFLTFTGSGPGILAGLAGSFTGGDYAGRIEGVYLDGYGASTGAPGIQVQDVQGIEISNVALYGWPKAGLYYVNGSGYAEESTVRCRIVQCGTYGDNTTGAVVFSGTSFDYGTYDFTIVTSPGTNGVVLRDSAQLRGASLRVRGNFYARASANTGAVIAIDPDNSTGGIGNGSYITDAHLDVAVEAAGSSGLAHTLVLMGSTSASSQFLGSGVLSFNPNGPTQIFSPGFSNPNSCPFGFSGYIQDGTADGPPFTGDALMIHGGTETYPNGSLSSSAGGTGVDFYWQFGDIAEGKLNNGSNTLVFHGVSSATCIRRVRLFLAQPASGAAGTVVWPSVKWPGGSAPTLSSTNGYVDQVDLVYLPDTAAWYGTLMGVHYS